MGNGTIPERNPGIMVELLDEVASRAGFSWRNSFSSAAFSDTGFETYSELLQWSTKNYDISADYWDRSLERIRLGISFPKAWFINDVIMVTFSKMDNRIQMFSFLKPFSRELWFAVVATLMFSAYTYFLIARMEADPGRKKQYEDYTEEENS